MHKSIECELQDARKRTLLTEEPSPRLKRRLDVVRLALLQHPLPSAGAGALQLMVLPAGTWTTVTDRAIVGAAADAHIQLLSPFVSAHHCEVRRHPDGSWRAVDLDSTNGTFANDARIASHVLHDGDILQAADVKLIVCLPDLRDDDD